MPPKKQPTETDLLAAHALIVMHASGRLLDETGADVKALAHAMWPTTIDRTSLELGSAAVELVCRACTIDAEQLTTIAQYLIGRK